MVPLAEAHPGLAVLMFPQRLRVQVNMVLGNTFYGTLGLLWLVERNHEHRLDDSGQNKPSVDSEIQSTGLVQPSTPSTTSHRSQRWPPLASKHRPRTHRGVRGLRSHGFHIDYSSFAPGHSERNSSFAVRSPPGHRSTCARGHHFLNDVADIVRGQYDIPGRNSIHDHEAHCVDLGPDDARWNACNTAVERTPRRNAIDSRRLRVGRDERRQRWTGNSTVDIDHSDIVDHHRMEQRFGTKHHFVTTRVRREPHRSLELQWTWELFFV